MSSGQERSGHPISSTEELQAAVAAVLDLPATDIGADDDLFALGLDSLRLLRLLRRWRRSGIRVSFDELACRPRLGDWCEMLAGSTNKKVTTEADNKPPGDVARLAPVPAHSGTARLLGRPAG